MAGKSVLFATLVALAWPIPSTADPRTGFLTLDPPGGSVASAWTTAQLCRRIESLEIRLALAEARASNPFVEDLTTPNVVEVVEALPRMDVHRERAELIENCLRDNLLRWDPVLHQVVRVPGGGTYVRVGARRRLDVDGLVALVEYLDGPHSLYMNRYIDPITRLALGGGMTRFAILELTPGQEGFERRLLAEALHRAGESPTPLVPSETTASSKLDVAIARGCDEDRRDLYYIDHGTSKAVLQWPVPVRAAPQGVSIRGGRGHDPQGGGGRGP